MIRIPQHLSAAFFALALSQAGLACVADPAMAEQPLSPSSQPQEAPLHFSVTEGKIYNEFYRSGSSAAHTVLTSGTKPRLIVAFPAGNSGVSLWFDEQQQAANWRPLEFISPISKETPAGPLYGIEATVTAQASSLTINRAVLGNIRAIRTYMHEATVDSRLTPSVKQQANDIVWSRERLDGLGGYALSLKMLSGSISHADDGRITLIAGKDSLIRFQMQALTGDTPLTPIAPGELLNATAADDPLSRNILAFLTYKEKMLAGSWRFNTYFGRDTLLSTSLLMPTLKPQGIDAAIISVLNRLAPNGQVAHEEEIAEFAVMRHMDETGHAAADPVYDYAMIDEGYLLAPMLAKYMAMGEHQAAHLKELLIQKSPSGATFSDLFARNVEYVLNHAQPFVNDPVFENLIRIKDGSRVGEWRDSQEGLGNGRYPYNVNAVLVPAALEAIADLARANLIADEGLAERAAVMAQVWTDHAPALFEVSLQPSTAQAKIDEYAKENGIPSIAAKSMSEGLVQFPALSLDTNGEPVSVVHSDPAFLLFFSDPEIDQLEKVIFQIRQPFPAGLMTPVGMLVSNPAFADAEVQSIFTKGHYHGPVVWPWQQAMMAAGLDRQINRKDLPKSTRDQLLGFQKELWTAIQNGHPVKTAELWSWNYEGGTFHPAPYGQGQAHLTESNAAQLWSTVFLAISPPR
ncbi:hypothetical protein ACFO5Q_08990 [Kordiimonas lipolytica]|uniref:Lipoprotein n=1 Tax=Kordiimonas lipolytica TaxID=1662421 RepID=A0ABV8U9Y9_9PROT|nr:hypothetical protein [Kordiimonas lipolytica]